MTLPNKIKNINYNILELSDTIRIITHFFGDGFASDSKNTFTSNSKIDYVMLSERFDGSSVT